jgi:hypothetical protein
MPPKLNVNFAPLSGANFLARAGAIVDALRNNPDFPEPWPAPLPSFTQLETAYDAYREVLEAAAVDKTRIAEREIARYHLTAFLKALAGYLEQVARDDGAKLLRTSYDLQKKDNNAE